MDFIKQYLKVISYVCTGLVFVFAAFYLLANCYHYMELRRDYQVSFNGHSLVVSLNETLNQVQENINSYNPNSYIGSLSNSKMTVIKQSLNQCIDVFNNETIKSMQDKTKITIVDVYKLRESYEDDVLNNCIVTNLYWLTTIDSSYGSTYLYNNKDITKLYIDSLLSSTSYLKKDLLNNSSYFYNTNVASTSMKDNTRDGFNEVMDAYNKAADFVLYVSNWFRMEAGG